MQWLAAATGELLLLVVAGVDVAHQLCKAGVRGSIPLVSTTLDLRKHSRGAAYI